MEESSCLTLNQFYGKTSGSSLSHLVENRMRMMQANPVSLPEPPRLNGDPRVWRTFRRQSSALEFAKETGMGVMAFAFEGKTMGCGGRRSFLACHPKVLWRAVKDRPLASRCIYEVIPESHFCKLYFDLEFSRPLNPNVDGVKTTNTFISIVNHYLMKEFSVNCGPADVLDLESTTDVKFSRHLIYNSSKVVFADNAHVGRFVKMICDDLRKDAQRNCNPTIPGITKNDIEMLFIKTNSSNAIFCDEGVYSRNRNFRTYRSTKYGKNSPLVISVQNKYVPVSSSDEQQYFLDSLITFVPDSTKILRYRQPVNSPLNIPKSGKGAVNGKHLSSNTSPLSPYIEIEMYIHAFLGEDNLIRNWRYFSQDEILVFEIDKRHRFCANIGREHKSNSVMYVVNLKKGIFYQKCYDPNCYGYKSNEIPLPPETMPWKLDERSFDSLSASEDESLLTDVPVQSVQEAEFSAEKQILSGLHDMCDPSPSSNNEVDTSPLHLPTPQNKLTQIESLFSQELRSQTADENNAHQHFATPQHDNSFSEVEWTSIISDEEMLSFSC